MRACLTYTAQPVGICQTGHLPLQTCSSESKALELDSLGSNCYQHFGCHRHLEDEHVDFCFFHAPDSSASYQESLLTFAPRLQLSRLSGPSYFPYQGSCLYQDSVYTASSCWQFHHSNWRHQDLI